MEPYRALWSQQLFGWRPFENGWQRPWPTTLGLALLPGNPSAYPYLEDCIRDGWATLMVPEGGGASWVQ